MKEKYYITTAIPYTSGKPHIGNTYEMILTDCIARYKRLCGYDVLFLTGADEHGQKIELAAAEKGVTPQSYVDNITGEMKKIWDSNNPTTELSMILPPIYLQKNTKRHNLALFQ